MKALVCHQITDDFSGLEVRDIAVPEPGEGEVRVRVKAAGVNFPDLLMSQGKYQFKPELPFTLGMEVAGVIDAVGDGVSEWKPGDKVIGGTLNGTGSFIMRADRVGAETMLSQIVKMVAEAQRSRAPIQRLADAVSGYFVPAVILVALIAFGVWAAVGPHPSFAYALVIARPS